MTAWVGSWEIEDARAKFDELIDRAISDGPQAVALNGTRLVVVVSAEEWDRSDRHRGDLVEFFANSPLREEGLTIERVTDHTRDLDL